MEKIADLTMPNAYVPGGAELSPENTALVDRRSRLLGPAYRLMYEKPLHFERGDGAWLYSTDGRAYLDAYNNVTSLGHCHPRVVAAIRDQAGRLATNTRYLHGLILEYAEELLATFPSELGHVMFACTGSEANDLAYRIAKQFTGGTGIIVTDSAYHGITDAVSQFSPTLGSAVSLGAHVRTVPAPSFYQMAGKDVAATFAENVRQAAADLMRHGIKPAMLIVDTLFTSDGILTAPRSFLSEAVEAIHNVGGLFVADEVQPGFGRTGDHMWGFQRHGVLPDLVTLGKPMGNGQPISGVVIKPEVVDSFGRNARYFNTFAGNAVSCAAALAVLRAINEEKLLENARSVGEYLLTRLKETSTSQPVIGDARGAGLFAGVELVSDLDTRRPNRVAATKVVNHMRENGVLISTCGPGHNILKIRPPLIFTKANVDTFVDAYSSALSSL